MSEQRLATAYIVTSGEYSDYSIDAVFSSRQLAQEWITKKQAPRDYPSDYDIAEWTVDAEKDARSLTVWTCGIFLDSGEVTEQGSYTEVLVPFRGRVKQECVAVPAYRGRKVARVESAVSASHAVKVAVEHRQKWLRTEKETAKVSS